MQPTSDPAKEIDRTLVKRIRAGDELAFDQLATRYYSDLLMYLTYALHSQSAAEDALQTLFFRLWRNPSSLPDDGNVRLYLFGAAKNVVLNTRRGERRSDQALSAYAREPLPIEKNPIDTLIEEDLRVSVQRCIDQMPERVREVFRLHRDHHLTYQEIGTLLGISTHTVKFHIGRATRILRDLLTAGESPDYP